VDEELGADGAGALRLRSNIALYETAFPRSRNRFAD
jgi:hypothetical protein